jgi:hypothetical protein
MKKFDFVDYEGIALVRWPHKEKKPETGEKQSSVTIDKN